MVPRHPPPLAVLPSYRLADLHSLGGVEPAQEGAQAIAAWVADDILGATFFDDDAVIHEDDAVRRLAREHHLVGDDDHRYAVACGKVLHHREHFPHQLGVERRGDLVEEHHLWFHSQSARDGHPLLLTTGELRRIDVGLVAESDTRE